MDITHFDIPQIVLYHLASTFIPWLIMMILGGTLGYLLAFFLRKWIHRSLRLLLSLTFFPWRSIASSSALVAISSPLVIITFGLGSLSTLITVGVTLLVFIVPITAQVFLFTSYPLSQSQRLFSFARTLAVLATALPVLFHMGIGNPIDWALSSNNEQQAYEYYGITCGMMLLLDILLGTIIFILNKSNLSKEKEVEEKQISL